VQALFIDPSAPLVAQFERAKGVSIALAGGLVILVSAFFARTLPRREAWLAGILAAFTLFAYRAAYVQAELLYYTFALFGFAALLRLWTLPSVTVAVAAGVFEAAAFLTKGSVQPGLALFAGLFTARAAWSVRRGGTLRSFARELSYLATALATFALLTAPYLAESRARYGSLFFNVNTRYVLWTDSWEDFRTYEARLGGWWTWTALPQDQLPSMGHYLATHSLLAIAKREVLGLGEMFGNALMGHGYFEFTALLLTFAATSTGFTRAPMKTLRAIDPRSPAAFALPYALLYVLLFGFYGPIAAGPRFLLTLYLPVLYVILRWGASRAPSAPLFGRTVTWTFATDALLVLAVLHVLFVVPMTIGRLYAGG
jgi:hypothetical protein